MARVPKNPRYNCYFGCKEEGPLHHFPKPHSDSERFNVWKRVLEHETKEKGNTYIYNQVRLCNKHFENYFISPSNRLTRNAVPTLYVNDETVACPQLDVTPSTSAEISSVSAALVPKVTTITLKRKLKTETVACPQLDVTPSTSAEISSVSAALVPKVTTITLKRKLKTGSARKSDPLRTIEKLSQRVVKLTQKCKTQTKKIYAAKKIADTKYFMKIIEGMPDSLQTFLKMQLKSKKKAKGRKFTIKEKILSASIWKQSQKGYNFLRKFIVLPSKRTIQRLLSTFCIKPGINTTILRNLKEIVEKLPLEKRIFTLLFDEVSLSPGLYFNKKEIIGFEDFGDKKTKNIADHALVLMIKGVKTKSKQPILFNYCKSSTKKVELKKIIIDTIKQLKNAGIIILATICDQATSNVSTIRALQKETKEKYLKQNTDYNSNAFEVENLKIFPLFDTPHLLKGVRNNFLIKDIKFKQDGKIKLAKWEHLRMLLNEDRGEDEIRIVNKLTEYHVDPTKISKMKVKYAAQIFSQRVSAVMRFLAKHKILPEDVEDTADLLIIFDKLFDSFNGHLYHDTAKVLKGCLKNNSPHFQFWDEITTILKTIEFVKVVKNRDGTETIKYEKVPSVQNWIHNINTFKEMWKHLNQNFKVNNILTRNFNQDPLENFFCCIRSNGIRNVNPTCMQFANAYKTLLINNMNSNHSISANCEKDDYKPLQSMEFLLSEKNDSLDDNDFACEVDSLITTMNEIKASDTILHAEAKKYVAGYLIKKCKIKIIKKCKTCMNDLMKSEVDTDSFNYMIDYTKKSLFNASDDFVKLLNEIYFMIVTCLRNSPEFNNLKDKIIFFINCGCDFSIITCSKHKLELIDYLINLSINLIVNSWCRNVNRILIGKIVDFDFKDTVKLQALQYNKSHRKRK